MNDSDIIEVLRDVAAKIEAGANPAWRKAMASLLEDTAGYLRASAGVDVGIPADPPKAPAAAPESLDTDADLAPFQYVPHDLRLITISGNRAGCGKSLLAGLLARAIPGSRILEMDVMGGIPPHKLQAAVLDQMEKGVVISVGGCGLIPHWGIQVTRYGDGEGARP